MFRFFETLVDPFPRGEAVAPPRRLVPFIMHYSRPVLPWLIVMATLTALISIIEISFVSFMGSLVDWLTKADRATFFQTHAWALAGMARGTRAAASAKLNRVFFISRVSSIRRTGSIRHESGDPASADASRFFEGAAIAARASLR